MSAVDRVRGSVVARRPLARRSAVVASAIAVAASLATVISGSTPAFATGGIGSPDTSFGTSGTGLTSILGQTGRVQAVAVDSLGRVIGVGFLNGSPNQLVVERFLSSGATDTSFGSGSNGFVTDPAGTFSQANAVTTDGSNNIFVAGYSQDSSGKQTPLLLEYSSGGTPVSGFNAAAQSALTTDGLTGLSQARFTSVLIGANGDIIVTGTISPSPAAPFGELVVAAFLSTGALDTSFASTSADPGIYFQPIASTFVGEVGNSIASIGSSLLVVAGESQCTTNGLSQAVFTELNLTGSSVTNGTVASGFAAGGIEHFGSCISAPSITATAVTVAMPSGTPTAIYASGTSTTSGSGSALLFGLDPSGAPLSGFSGGFNTQTGSTALDAGNSIVLVPSATSPDSIEMGGTLQTASTPSAAYAAAITSFELDGTGATTEADISCDNVGPLCASGLAVQADGNFLMTGGLEGGGAPQFSLAVARLLFSAVSIQSAAPVTITATTIPDAVFKVQFVGASGSNPTVRFSTANGTAAAGTNYNAITNEVIQFPCTTSGSHYSCESASLADVPVTLLYPAGATGTLSFSATLSGSSGPGIAVATGSASITYPALVSTTTTTPTTTPATTTVTTTPATTTATTVPVTKTTVPTKSSSSAGGGGTTTSSAPVAAGKGYWLVSSSGVVTAYGDARAYGSVAKKKLSGTITAIAATSNGKGYWLVSTTGTVYAFGSAKSFGSVAKNKLSGKVESITPIAGGTGYWLVSTTGAVYGFGKAKTYGSVAKKNLHGTVTGFAPGPSSKGYWLVSTTGTVYAFGSAKSFGSVAAGKLTGSAVGIALSTGDKGYWVLSSKGGVYAFGKAKNFGSVKISSGTAQDITATPTGAGYWVVASTGTVYAFGNAKYYGQTHGGGVVGVATT